MNLGSNHLLSVKWLTVNNKASIKLGGKFLLTACVFCEAVKPNPSKLWSNPLFTNSTKRESPSFASFAKDPWTQENRTCAKQPWRSRIPNLKSGGFHPPLHTMVKSLTHLGHKVQTHCSHPLLLLLSSPLLCTHMVGNEEKKQEHTYPEMWSVFFPDRGHIPRNKPPSKRRKAEPPLWRPKDFWQQKGTLVGVVGHHQYTPNAGWSSSSTHD